MRSGTRGIYPVNASVGEMISQLYAPLPLKKTTRKSGCKLLREIRAQVMYELQRQVILPRTANEGSRDIRREITDNRSVTSVAT